MFHHIKHVKNPNSLVLAFILDISQKQLIFYNIIKIPLQRIEHHSNVKNIASALIHLISEMNKLADLVMMTEDLTEWLLPVY